MQCTIDQIGLEQRFIRRCKPVRVEKCSKCSLAAEKDLTANNSTTCESPAFLPVSTSHRMTAQSLPPVYMVPPKEHGVKASILNTPRPWSDVFLVLFLSESSWVHLFAFHYSQGICLHTQTCGLRRNWDKHMSRPFCAWLTTDIGRVGTVMWIRTLGHKKTTAPQMQLN